MRSFVASPKQFKGDLRSSAVHVLRCALQERRKVDEIAYPSLTDHELERDYVEC
jgi:hypothetical protein